MGWDVTQSNTLRGWVALVISSHLVTHPLQTSFRNIPILRSSENEKFGKPWPNFHIHTDSSMRCNRQIKPVSADPFKLSLCTSLVYILALMHPHVALSSPEFQVHLVAHMKSHTSHRR